MPGRPGGSEDSNMNNVAMLQGPTINNSGANPSSQAGVAVNFPGVQGASLVDLDSIADQVRILVTNEDGTVDPDRVTNLLQGAGNINLGSFLTRQSHSSAGQTVQLNSVGTEQGDSSLDWAQIAATSHVELVMRSEKVLSGKRLQVSGKVLVARQRTDTKKIEFGTICDDGWGEEEAKVVCGVVANRLQLPLIRASPSATFNASASSSTGAAGAIDNAAVKLDGVQCQGNEEDILQCKHDGWGVHNCAGHEAAFVTCTMQ